MLKPAPRHERERLPLREDRFFLGYVITRAFQQFWRATRGVYLDVEACLVDEAGRILMVRNEAGGEWRLPSSAVYNGENLETALRRLMREVAGVEVNAKPELEGFSAKGKSRQTGTYIVRDWQRLSASKTGDGARNGIWEMRFFSQDALPAGVTKRAAERISRLSEARTISQT